jgi:hypothetical protein
MLIEHPEVSPLSERPVLVTDAIAQLLPRVEDSPRFLPREAALAFREFRDNMARRLGSAASPAISWLTDHVVASMIHIEAYGDLPLVRPQSRSGWLEILGEFFVLAAEGTSLGERPKFACDKDPTDMLGAPLLAKMSKRSRLISVLRHPAAAAASLSESSAIDRPLGESVDLVRMHYERWLTTPRLPLEVVIRFEDLLTEPRSVLKDLGVELGLTIVSGWTGAAASVVEGWSHPGMRHSRVIELAARDLADVSCALGYGGVTT